MSPKKATVKVAAKKHSGRKAKNGRGVVAPVASGTTLPIRSAAEALADPFVTETFRRGIMKLDGDGENIIYSLRTEQRFAWNDPEEWVRAANVAWLILDRDYPTNRI